MRLILISGLSGSGKSVALNMLEDLNYYCVDNIPAALLKPFISHTVRSRDTMYQRTAVGPASCSNSVRSNVSRWSTSAPRALGLDPVGLVLWLRRFAETRRRHPMSRGNESLHEAISLERRMLEPIVQASDFIIDTSRMGVHDLREMVRSRVDARQLGRISILFESFGFKYGIPGDPLGLALARPEPELRKLSGRDAKVAQFLERSDTVPRLIADITRFVEARIPEYQTSNRRYFTVAIGCTGGQHRSVYLVEKIAADFSRRFPDVSVRHSGLDPAPATP